MACGVWLWVCCGSWIGGYFAVVLEGSAGPVTALVSIELAINAVWLLRSSTNNKISVCGWCKFCFLFVFFC